MYACQAFEDWVQEMKAVGKHNLVAVVKKEARSFSSIFVASVKERLSSTWDYIQCLELIDPLGPDPLVYATPAVWDALRDLYDRRNIEDKTGKDFDSVREDILRMRAQAQNLDIESKSLIRSDLCAYLRERRQGFRVCNCLGMNHQPLPTMPCTRPYSPFLSVLRLWKVFSPRCLTTNIKCTSKGKLAVYVCSVSVL